MSPENVLADAIGARLASRRSAKPLVVGLCGPQGSGKSTIAAALTKQFDRSVTLSIDDLYLGHEARLELAKQVHPLLATRGVPGTHDVKPGIEVLDALDRGEAVALPRFDKAQDDLMPPERWPVAPAACALVIFEGWCVGARPQRADEFAEPINALEADEDRDGRWRRFVNDVLAGEYQQLFNGIDMLVLLAAPDWGTVVEWRIQQEHELRAANPGAPGLMDDSAIPRFVSHYERLTRHMLAEMPSRADLVLRLNAARQCVGLSGTAMAHANGRN